MAKPPSAARVRLLVASDFAALPRDLIEDELFGHRRGASSGALRDHPGIFVGANGGTLLLDEIAELPLKAQTKLLRLLQDDEVRPIGGLESQHVRRLPTSGRARMVYPAPSGVRCAAPSLPRTPGAPSREVRGAHHG